jgi:hypothetical protein
LAIGLRKPRRALILYRNMIWILVILGLECGWPRLGYMRHIKTCCSLEAYTWLFEVGLSCCGIEVGWHQAWVRRWCMLPGHCKVFVVYAKVSMRCTIWPALTIGRQWSASSGKVWIPCTEESKAHHQGANSSLQMAMSHWSAKCSGDPCMGWNWGTCPATSAKWCIHQHVFSYCRSPSHVNSLCPNEPTMTPETVPTNCLNTCIPCISRGRLKALVIWGVPVVTLWCYLI